jgi:hypothetical protein
MVKFFSIHLVSGNIQSVFWCFWQIIVRSVEVLGTIRIAKVHLIVRRIMNMNETHDNPI